MYTYYVLVFYNARDPYKYYLKFKAKWKLNGNGSYLVGCI